VSKVQDRLPDAVAAAIDPLLRGSARREVDVLIVFGSMATGEARPTSDVDVLVVGSPECVVSSRADVVAFPRDRFDVRAFEVTELGQHVARFGVPVIGQLQLRCRKVSEAALRAKARKATASLRSLARLGALVPSQLRSQLAVDIRRDLQRLALLQNGEAVPTRWALDDAWKRRSDDRAIAAAAVLWGVMFEGCSHDPAGVLQGVRALERVIDEGPNTPRHQSPRG